MTRAEPVQRVRDTEVGVESRANSWSLMICSCLLLHLAIQDGSPRPWIEWIDLLVTTLLAVAGYKLFRLGQDVRTTGVPPDRHRERNPSTGTLVVRTPRSRSLTTDSLPTTPEVVCLIAFGALPFVTDVLMRQFLYHGNPLEIQVTLALRNLMFGLMILPTKRTGRLAIFTSLFLAIYGALVAAAIPVNVLLAIYALLGLWWLMGNYWQRISAHFPNESTTEIPYSARVGAIVLVMFCLAGGALAFQSSSVTSAVAGFLPSSGGTGGSDPFARGGVGDGDQIVGATEDASSFGPIESELFLESQQPTLYDMLIENYEPPSPKKRGRTRAIPLMSQVNQKQNHTKLAQNKKASREFSAVRRRSGERKRLDLDSIKSKALLYVAGRTPVHLALATFDHWDGRELSQRVELPSPKLRLDVKAGKKWATWENPPKSPCFGAPERHILKIINLNSATVPAPPTTTAMHLDKLHDARFFQWEDGMLRIQSKKIPSLTVLHVESRPVRRDRVAELTLRKNHPDPPPQEESRLSGRLHQLAAAWTDNAQSDWEHVARICEQLRTFDHDPEVLVPDGTDDAVEHFLFESQQGPDYLFATSAAVLLRTAGYHTRVVSGFYVDPDNYDRMAKATGVYANNVHFWTEIQTVRGHWIAVEPTPGFEQLFARQTILEGVAATMSRAWRGIIAHPVMFSCAAIAVLAVILCRSRLYAWAATSWWRLRLNSTPRQQVLSSVLLLQRLTQQKKSERQIGQTLDQWIESMSRSLRDSSSIADFRALVSWACYASSDRPVIATALVRQTCVDSVKLLKERV